MRFHPDTLRRISSGEITLAFRRWRRPTVRAGGTLHTAHGLLAIDALAPIEARDISDGEARLAGYPGRAALLQELRGEGTLYRIAISPLRSEPALAPRGPSDDDELTALCAKLQALDQRALAGPWTARTLRAMIEPKTLSAAQLADRLQVDPEQLTRNLRKLAALGLCERRDLSYHLSPRGKAVLPRLGP